MRKRKLFAVAMAGTLALSSVIVPGCIEEGMVETVLAADDEEEAYHAYLVFQTGDYTFRNTWDETMYGLNGSSNTSDIDYSVVHAWDETFLCAGAGTFTDAVITGDGTYTVSVSGMDLSSSFRILGISTDIPLYDYGYIVIVSVKIGDDEFYNPDSLVDYDGDYIYVTVENEYQGISLGDYEAASPQDVSITFAAYDIAFKENSGTCGENLTWSLDENGVLTISGTGEMENFSSGWSVPWKDSFDDITSVVIEEGVTSIGDNAFIECNNLTTIKIPDSMTSIGESAFYSCDSLTSVKIPDNVTDIGERAFYECISLESVDMSDSVTNIGYATFAGCTSLTSIEIPGNVTIIEASAFNNCTSLTSVKLASGLTNIESYAFYYCSSLASIEIPDSVESIGSYAFCGCDELADENGFIIIDDILFGYCGDDTEIDIPDNVVRIDKSVFRGNESVKSVKIPESVTDIGDYAFAGCSSLTDLEFSNDEATIGDGAFWECAGLADEDGFVMFNNVIFDYCGEDSEVEIPSGVTTISYAAFFNADVTNVTIPSSVTSIGNYAFVGCVNLRSIVVPASVEYIGYCAFGYFPETDSTGSLTAGFLLTIVDETYTLDIYGYAGSAAETYVEEYGWGGDVITFIALEETTSGDINLDGSIDYLDAMTALRYDAELIELTDAQITAADVNDDGSVDSLDAILMLRYDAGLIESF